MKIHLQHIGRRYNREWIFRSFDYTFRSGDRCAILGPNGSGKSTLLKVISGYLTASEGKLTYQQNAKDIVADEIYSHISIAAPYIDLIEDFTLVEMLDFHFKFKSILPTYTYSSVIDYLQLQPSSHKAIKHYSSGMKQRVKLALACFAESDILLLDEPTSNLDEQGVAWYRQMIHEIVDHQKILIIGSNQQHEYDFCEKKIYIEDYKHEM